MHKSKNDSSSCLKNIFKTNFKFIDFHQASSVSTVGQHRNDDDKNDDSIKEFYQNLVINQQQKQQQQSEIMIEKTKPTQVKTTGRLTERQLLRATQENDRSSIMTHLNDSANASSLMAVDAYGWSCLMIAVASHHNDLVRRFLTFMQDDKSMLNEFLNLRDSSGMTALDIAQRVDNRQARELIEQSQQSNSESKPETKSSHELSESNHDNDTHYCELCQTKFRGKVDKHTSSIVHLLNDKSHAPTNTYFLRSSNKGYKLLCKQGWNEQSGLGANEQGKIHPVRAQIKNDRLGLGLTSISSSKPSAISSSLQVSSAKNVKLKRPHRLNGDAGLLKTAKTLQKKSSE